MFIQGKAKYTCLQKPAFVVRTVEGTAEPLSLVLTLYYLPLPLLCLLQSLKGIIFPEAFPLQQRPSDLMEPRSWG